MEPLFTVLIWISAAFFAAAALMSLIRIIRGPSVVDRMVGSDTLATVLICVLSADMALRGHTTTLPLVLGLAMTASIGTMAVARFVSRGRSGNSINSSTTDQARPEHDDVERHRDTDGSIAQEEASRHKLAHDVVAREVRRER
jgi:multicomponent Na+:H+ antiporter subunit F